MIIPKHWELAANRYGNKCMIDKIMAKVPSVLQPDIMLLGILPNRQGIVICIEGVEEPITLLADTENYELDKYITEPVKTDKRSRRK